MIFRQEGLHHILVFPPQHRAGRVQQCAAGSYIGSLVFQNLQLKILTNQARYLRPGGTLLYSTCTVLKRENEDVVNAFLAGHPDFETVPLELPEVFPKNESGMLTLIPGQYDTDGFFICRLRRKA